jgi:hypothetical protein
MQGFCNHISRLFLIVISVAALSACGGDSGDGGASSTATFTGTVAGTTIVAYAANNNKITSVVATGTGTKGFSLTLPVGDIYKFYFIENENSASERVLPLYVGSVNLFSIDSGVTIDLGFVDTTTNLAVPSNSPLDVNGVSSGGEDISVPLSYGFTGTYPTVYEYELNISSGVAMSEASDLVVELSRQDDTHFTLGLSDSGPVSYTLPLVRNAEVARIATSPLDVGDCYLLELMVLSDGSNMSLLEICQEYFNPVDISFILANWVRDSVSVTSADFAGTWDATIQENPSFNTVFSESNLNFSITAVDSDTITVNFRGDSLPLDVVDGRATLVGAPVVIGSKMYHSFCVRTDGEGLSFYKVVTALDTVTDISIGLGLAQRQ